MKSISQWIQEIESEFEVAKVTTKGVPIWPFYKVFLFDQLYVPGGTLVQLSTSKKLSLAKQSLFGFSNYLKGDFTDIAFSSSEQRKEVDSYFPDKLIDGIRSELPAGTSLGHFELPVTPHRPSKQLPNKQTASKLPLRVAEAVYAKQKGPLELEGEEIVTAIRAKTGTTISLEYVANRFWSQYKAMKLFLKNKPRVKRLWIVSSYMNYGSLYAAKQAGITVIEVQHGTISKEHFGYYHTSKWYIPFYPDYLLSFGENEQAFFANSSNFVDRDNVIPVGHFYIESIYQKALYSSTASEPIHIAVSLQDDAIGEKLVPFMIQVANSAPDFIIWFSPRRKEEAYYRSNFELPSNIRFQPDWNVYEAISRAEIHSTVYSTCAIEAPSLGTPNVIVNIDNRGRDYFQQFLSEENYTWYADSPNQYIEMVRKVFNKKELEQENIRAGNNRNIKANYFRNVKSFLQQVAD